MKANKIECFTEGKQQVNKQSLFWIKYTILLAIMLEKPKQQQKNPTQNKPMTLQLSTSPRTPIGNK